ncbi:MAG TPA: VanZ family protein [Candidatus Ozemobacteraceae bacterium]|nr:VanZ family protein [Candidatus Ozemobacteraceae bacterium]
MKRRLTYRLSQTQAVLTAAAYCAVIFFISSRPRPTEELLLPTGPIPHFVEYLGLGTLAWVNLWLRRPLPNRFHRLHASLAFCAFYAFTDEIHQAFVPLRSCEPIDWLIDIAGSLSGIMLMEWLTARRSINLKRAG